MTGKLLNLVIALILLAVVGVGAIAALTYTGVINLPQLTGNTTSTSQVIPPPVRNTPVPVPTQVIGGPEESPKATYAAAVATMYPDYDMGQFRLFDFIAILVPEPVMPLEWWVLASGRFPVTGEASNTQKFLIDLPFTTWTVKSDMIVYILGGFSWSQLQNDMKIVQDPDQPNRITLDIKIIPCVIAVDEKDLEYHHINEPELRTVDGTTELFKEAHDAARENIANDTQKVLAQVDNFITNPPSTIAIPGPKGEPVEVEYIPLETKILGIVKEANREMGDKYGQWANVSVDIVVQHSGVNADGSKYYEPIYCNGNAIYSRLDDQ